MTPKHCRRCDRSVGPSAATVPLCWGAAQCDAGRMAALEAALRAVLPYVHPDVPIVEDIARAFRLVS